MTVEMPGTRPWVKAIKSDFAPALPDSVGIPLGGALHKRAIDPRIKPGSRAYRATMRLTAGVGLLQIVQGEIGPLTITTPAAGAVVPPVHDIAGTGAIPGGDVELWHVEGNVMVATATPDAEGNWIFGGDTPATLGTVTWQVRQGPRPVAEVTITVEEPVGDAARSEDAPWDKLTTHAQIDGYVDDEGIDTPAGWDGWKLSDKKTWLDEHY